MNRRKFVRHCGLLGGLLLVANAAALEATLDWDRETVLSMPVKGVVTRLEVRPGDKVARGALMVQLDQRPFRNRIDALEAKLGKLEAVLAEARRELERAEELYDRTVLSEHELQLKKNDFIAARADYEAARAELTAARLAREYSNLRAPFALRVLAREVEIGQTVVADLRPTPVLRVAAEDTLLAVAEVDAEQAAKLSLDQELIVTIGNLRRTGQLVAVAPLGGEKPGRYRIAVRLPRKGADWLAGQKANIRLP